MIRKILLTLISFSFWYPTTASGSDEEGCSYQRRKSDSFGKKNQTANEESVNLIFQRYSAVQEEKSSEVEMSSLDNFSDEILLHIFTIKRVEMRMLRRVNTRFRRLSSDFICEINEYGTKKPILSKKVGELPSP